MTTQQTYIYGAYISTLSDKSKSIIRNEIVKDLGLLKNVCIAEINIIINSIENMRLKDFEFLVDTKRILNKFK